MPCTSVRERVQDRPERLPRDTSMFKGAEKAARKKWKTSTSRRGPFTRWQLERVKGVKAYPAYISVTLELQRKDALWQKRQYTLRVGWEEAHSFAHLIENPKTKPPKEVGITLEEMLAGIDHSKKRPQDNFGVQHHYVRVEDKEGYHYERRTDVVVRKKPSAPEPADPTQQVVIVVREEK